MLISRINRFFSLVSFVLWCVLAAFLASSNIFPKKIFVNIIGSVNQPGSTEIKSNTPLVQAIMMAGGPIRWRSDKGNVELIRINQNGTAFRKKFRIDLRQSVSKQNNPILRDGDLIKVNPSLIQNIASGVGAVTDADCSGEWMMCKVGCAMLHKHAGGV